MAQEREIEHGTHATLLEVVAPDAYTQLDHVTDGAVADCRRARAEHDLPREALGVGEEDMATFASVPSATTPRSAPTGRRLGRATHSSTA